MDLLRNLAATVEGEHPLVYCCTCLATKLGADELKVRDTAQMLLFRERQSFVLARRTCAGCRETDQMLVFRRGGA